MTATQAAEIIGCTAAHVRSMCRCGKMRSKKSPIGNWGEGFYYEISQKEAERIRDSANRRSTRGQRRAD